MGLEAESVAVPAIRSDTVVVKTIDGILRGLSVADGSTLWSVEHSPPALTLRGSAQPIIIGSTVIAGFDNGRLIAVNLIDGTTEWEQMLSSGAACQTMLIAALSMGYAAQWLTEWFAYDDEVKNAIGAGPEDRIAVFLYFGNETAEPTERARPDYENVVSEWSPAG